jgi:hypothetical protein
MAAGNARIVGEQAVLMPPAILLLLINDFQLTIGA